MPRHKMSRQAKPPKSALTRTGSEPMVERFGTLGEMDRLFDILFWQRQGDAAIYRAAWELVEFYQRDQRKDPDELRLQRTLEHFQRR